MNYSKITINYSRKIFHEMYALYSVLGTNNSQHAFGKNYKTYIAKFYSQGKT